MSNECQPQPVCWFLIAPENYKGVQIDYTGLYGQFYLGTNFFLGFYWPTNLANKQLLIKIDAYISLCNIDHDSSDQIVYYMIVEQEPFTIGICRFLKKRSQVLQIQTYNSIKTKIELTCLCFGGHRYPVWQWRTLLVMFSSNIARRGWSLAFIRCTLLIGEDLSGRRIFGDWWEESGTILWSWLNPIPWSWPRLMSSVSSSVVHPPSLSFFSFSFFFEYFSKSSLIFIWMGWWLLRMYKSCLETEQRSRFGSSWMTD